MRIMVRSKYTGDYVEPSEVAIDDTRCNDGLYDASELHYAVDDDDRLLVCADNGNFAYVLTDDYNVYIDHEGR